MVLSSAVNDKISVIGNTPEVVMRHRFVGKVSEIALWFQSCIFIFMPIIETAVTSYLMTVPIMVDTYPLIQH